MKKKVITVVALLLFGAAGAWAQSLVDSDNARKIERMIRNPRMTSVQQVENTPIIIPK